MPVQCSWLCFCLWARLNFPKHSYYHAVTFKELTKQLEYHKMATANSLIKSHLFLRCADCSPSAFLSWSSRENSKPQTFPLVSTDVSMAMLMDWTIGPSSSFLYPHPLPIALYSLLLQSLPLDGLLHVICLGLKDVSSCNANQLLECSCGWACCWRSLCHHHKNDPEEPKRTREEERHEGKNQSCRSVVWSKTNPADSDLYGGGAFRLSHCVGFCCAPLLWQKLIYWRCNSFPWSNQTLTSLCKVVWLLMAPESHSIPE